MGYLQLNQRQGDKYVKVGQLCMKNGGNLTLSRDVVYWHGHGKAPLDRIYIENQWIEPNVFIHSVLAGLASLGLLLAVFFLVINIKYASHRYIKMSSPKMNNVIVVGCLLVYSSIFIIRLNPSVSFNRILMEPMCTIRTWVLSIGFSLAFGPLFAKTWRVYLIFNSPHNQKRLITDGMLFVVVIALLLLDLVILITWVFYDRLKMKTSSLTTIEEENKLIIKMISTCESRLMNIWAATIYIYKGLLLVVGCFFAWQTRHVSIPALNDSKYIGMSVYNVVIMCTSAVAISYVIGDKQDHCDLIIGLLVILCTTITLCLVFVPKAMHLLEDPKGRANRPRLSIHHKGLAARKPLLSNRPSTQDCNNIEQNIAQLVQEIAANQSKLYEVTAELESLTSTDAMRTKQTQTNFNSRSSTFATTALFPPTQFTKMLTDYDGTVGLDFDVNLQETFV